MRLQRSRICNGLLLGSCGVGVCVGNESRDTPSSAAVSALLVVGERRLLDSDVAHGGGDWI